MKRPRPLCLPTCLFAFWFFTSAGHAEGFGRYLDELKTRWLDNGRDMELLEDFRFEDESKELWVAKKGSKIDGASIPQPLWSIIGGPFEGLYRNASVIHDYYCDHHLKDWQSTHRVFYNGMRASGVSEFKAKAMYYGVVAFGPRWTEIVRNRLSTQCMNANCTRKMESVITLTTTVASAVAVTERERNLVSELERRLAEGESLSLEELDNKANQDRKNSVPLPDVRKNNVERQDKIIEFR